LTSALTAKTPNQASVMTFTRVLILPWVLFAAVVVIVSFWVAGRVELGWAFYLNLWFWTGVAADLAFGLPAFWQLRTQFRELALRRFTASREPMPRGRTSPGAPPAPIRVMKSAV